MSDDKLTAEFRCRFGCEPQFIVRCPGRVNLIGEHVDYSGYGVLPMAIEQNVAAAVSTGKDLHELHLQNLDANYKSYKADKSNIQIDRSNVQWYDYFKSGYRGMLEYLGMENKVPNGMNVLLYGSVPAGSGLSSSSALVCCAAITTLRAQTGTDFDKCSRTEIAELCAKCERYVGMEGGGMDQAISMLATSGTAKHIEFHPLRFVDVKLPEPASFFVLHSCVSAHKVATSHYNERVVECRLAAQLTAKLKDVDAWKQVLKLCDLQQALGSPSFEEMKSIVKEKLHKEPYTRAELLQLLELADTEFADLSLNQNTMHIELFKLFDRAYYVFDESARVLQFDQVCSEDGCDSDRIKRLGQLMNSSHDSSAQLFECSCKELDELVNDCRQAGAFGARLTGAGWGGCVVALIQETMAEEFTEKLKSTYYSRNEERKTRFDKAVFLSRPAGGATVRAL